MQKLKIYIQSRLRQEQLFQKIEEKNDQIYNKEIF